MSDDMRETAYEHFVECAATERDFTLLKPWLRGRRESELSWFSRTIELAQQAYGQCPSVVHADLKARLARRIQKNCENRWALLPARLARFYYLSVRGTYAQVVKFPLLRCKHVSFGAKRFQTELQAVPRPKGRPQQPKASVVVLSFNRLAYLKTTLESLYATTKDEDYELIVVDNGSSDRSAEALRRLANDGAIDKLILRAHNAGTSAGFNTGFAFADPGTRYLVKLDSDITLLTPGWLDRVDTFLRGSADVGAVALEQVNHHALAVVPTDQVNGERVISWNYWVVGGACMTIPRSLFDRLGYFTEDYDVKYMPDDVDYWVRTSLLGLNCYYLRSAIAYHRHDLDSFYAGLARQKQREVLISRQRERVVYDEYLLRKRSLRVDYPQYSACRFPLGTRILELDAPPQQKLDSAHAV